MREPEIEAFPAGVASKLKTYVYRLIDPRNGEAFYVGKGQGNRVFSHIRAEQNLEGDEIDNKLVRIRQKRLAGFEVAHVVHRHGMDEGTAFEVEAALIDAYPGLTNIVGGTDGNDYGVMHAKELAWHQWFADREVVEIRPFGRALPPFRDYLRVHLSFDDLGRLVGQPDAHRDWVALSAGRGIEWHPSARRINGQQCVELRTVSIVSPWATAICAKTTEMPAGLTIPESIKHLPS
ncbi:MAG: hypothetical protein HY017_12915 [Betaproteobacteria bacterium]|nr:hypothetical protein [Betaproteobacteria bacterium]